MAGLTDIDRFIRAVRWRLGLARALERVGLFLAGGAVMAAILIPVQILMGGRPWWLTVGLLGLGAALGLIAGWRSWPTRLAAAMEADQQFQLDDLLSSVWLAERGGGVADAPWRTMLLAEGAARCQSLRPGGLVVRRWGAGRWGGVTLGMALVLTISAWWSMPGMNRAEAMADGGAGFLRPGELQVDRPIWRTPADDFHQRAAAPPSRGESDTGRRMADSNPSLANEPKNKALPSGAPRQGTSATASAGPGSAQTDHREAAAPDRPTFTHAMRPANATGPAAGGSAAPNEPTDAAASPESATMSDTKPTPPAPPWASDHWASDRARAEAAVREGRVPDAYRAMVGAYFGTSRP
jgi:hypothetical protein